MGQSPMEAKRNESRGTRVLRRRIRKTPDRRSRLDRKASRTTVTALKNRLLRRSRCPIFYQARKNLQWNQQLAKVYIV